MSRQGGGREVQVGSCFEQLATISKGRVVSVKLYGRSS